ncbi:hypothetical protein [uncultured Roseibium sp.]|uniref:hypothetical protein n=1 Tax=uncultured Roseibium sp. TaxID=1936171 RepID=UPI00261CC9D0|nr:hypothetical protein [uncultured Roseibium sp.]
MSEHALTWAMRQEVRGRIATDVLLTLASIHEEGGFCLETRELARRAGFDMLATAASLWELRNAGVIRCAGIGGTLSVELGCDYAQEAAE